MNHTMHRPRRGPLLVAAMTISLMLLVNAAGASHQPLVPVAVDVDAGFRFDDGRMIVGFNATPERDSIFKFQLGLAESGSCAFKQVQTQTLPRVVKAVGAGEGPVTRGPVPKSESASGGERHGGERFALFSCLSEAKVARLVGGIDGDLDGIHWGSIQEHRMKADETVRLEAFLRMPGAVDRPSPEHLGEGRLVIRLWEAGSSDSVTIGLGDSYEPPPEVALMGNASALALQNATFVFAGVAYKSHGSSTGQVQRDRDWSLPLPWPLLWLFTRLKRSKLLDHEARKLVHGFVEMNPGIRFADLQNRTGLASGVLTHHMRMLEEHGFLVSVHRGRQRHIYAKGCPIKQGKAGITERQTGILDVIATRPRTQAAIASMLGLSQQVVSYHLRRLMEDGRVARSRQRRRAWEYTLPPPYAGTEDLDASETAMKIEADLPIPAPATR